MKKYYQNKNVLITGGAGFIGSHIIEKLLEFHANITVLDNLSSGNIENIKPFLDQITFIEDDIRSKEICIKATKDVDVVFHLAALASVPESVKNPKLCNEINIEGTKNLLEAGVENNVTNFVLSSSAAIYGNRDDTCYETDIPNPQSPYAESKLEGERLCKKFAEKCGISTAVLRYFNVYGKRQNPNGDYAAVVAKFSEQLKEQEPITIFGTGKQTRDFIHVSKVVEANLTVGTQPNLKGEIFNIATGKSIFLFELIKQLEEELRLKNTGLIFKPERDGDILNSKADGSKYQNFVCKIDTLSL